MREVLLHGLARGEESLPSNHMKLPRRTVGTSKDVRRIRKEKDLLENQGLMDPLHPLHASLSLWAQVWLEECALSTVLQRQLQDHQESTIHRVLSRFSGLSEE